jgi:hypothetical protein
MNWIPLLVGLAIGLVAGIAIVSICAGAAYRTQSSSIINLTVALTECAQALEQDGPDPYARAAKNAKALRRARKVLNGETQAQRSVSGVQSPAQRV